MRNLTNSVSEHATKTREIVKTAQAKLAVLRGAYYDFALKISHQLRFGQTSEELFNQYRQAVDEAFAGIAPESLNKFSAAYENLSSNNPESWAQALTSCRRVFADVANGLFAKYLPEFVESGVYETESGKKLNVTKEKTQNQIFALLDKISKSKTTKVFHSAHLQMTIDYLERLNDLLCKGVHDDVDLDQTKYGILHTYLALGDIATQLKKHEN